MKLLLRRDQKSGLTGKVTFTLDARTQLTDEEAANVKKYKLGKEVLYEKRKVDWDGTRLIGVAARLAAKAINLTVTVDDLVKGKHLECKDIVEMRAVEEQLKEASALFKDVLETAAHFGGEEVLEM